MALYAIVLAVVAATPQPAPLADLMTSELARSMEVLAQQSDPPHYCSLVVTDDAVIEVEASASTLAESQETTSRYLDVDPRVGTPDLDSTHPLRGTSDWRSRSRKRTRIPIQDDVDFALRHALWREIDSRYREAREALVMIHANQSVRVAEEDPAPDFEPRGPVEDRVSVAPIEVDRGYWDAILVQVSARLDASPRIHSSNASIRVTNRTTTFVDTEATRLQHERPRARVMLYVSSTAEDGDRLSLSRHLDVHTAAELPSLDELSSWADELVAALEALLDAPRGEPYSGPVLLTGKAAGVFVHEVLGHRLEGHRQKREHEGKTFKEYVGRPILPAFMDIYDDPSLTRYAGEDLNGHYAYDDEGVPAQRASLVEDGVLVGFLMGRSPIEGFEQSNGHGRRSPGRAPVSRMGNTIVEVTDGIPFEQLRQQLLDEVEAQGLEYGVIVDEIAGGFTRTGRFFVNSFNVRSKTCWRVYPDGRPDELVRGIDLIGTPLEAFGNVIAAGDEPMVFNGFCGAESGSVPVSSVSPALLLSSLEFQLKEKGSDRPPLLPKPGGEAAKEVQP